MNLFTTLSLAAQTAYAQLFDAAAAAEFSRSVASLRGSFAAKTVKGGKYWYFQHTDVSGKLQQIYVGPDSPRVKALIAEHDANRHADSIQRMASSAVALGCQPLLLPHYRVIRRLADYGFFNAGGVLIGTHAFLVFGNMLGVHWGDTSRTQDVDFAHAGKHMAIALPTNLEMDTHAAIDSLQMGFLPTADISGRVGATYLNPRDPEFQLDFLTPLTRDDKIYEHPKLKINLQPLKFMEYLLEDVQQAALFGAEGAVVANVPHPARYALHKLIVFAERSAMRRPKANKDLQQSAALLSYFHATSAWDVKEAWKDLISRGPGWRTRAKRGRDSLVKTAPELDAKKWLPLPGEGKRARKTV
ncbi:MAG: nucleotidyltransferase domain-containing protein [Rudaea sp.]